MLFFIRCFSAVSERPFASLYEKEGLLPLVGRDSHGNRLFSEQDVEWISLVKCLRETGMKVSTIKHYVDLFLQGEETAGSSRQIMLNQKQIIEEKIESLDYCLGKINKKIEYYDGLLVTERGIAIRQCKADGNLIKPDKKLAAVCGLFCPSCTVYIESPERLVGIAERVQQPVEKLLCHGCRSEKRSYYCESLCTMYKCAADKGIDFCGECPEYSCEDLKVFQAAIP